ncbi:hypothetical protein LTR84_009757 [Exophiala bonariae]|uniref:Xylanolytic transcriptional activator regulatory domain-containing protein n=1 Tax=Exophiala bonariae TaxID=1690606 RepID=A0AAV9NK62_9EURO|nr:hypothetical protein LTR84_009757 [Exophiala bonariae]
MPRGRLQRKGNDIDARVARLEDLVKQLKAQVQTTNQHDAGLEDTHLLGPVGPLGRYSNGLQRYIASDFWEAISREANGIRKTLEESNNEGAPSANYSTSPGPTTEPYSIPNTLLFGHGTSGTEFDTSQPLQKHLASTLLSIYQHRVDSIVKVLHWPSVVAAIDKKNMEARNEGWWTGIHALESAIRFTAWCTTTDAECEQQLRCNRSSTLLQLRNAAEFSISKAKLLEYPDLTVLQAYVIYLIGLRCSTTGASSWTLLPIAVRLAKALGLGSEDPKSHLPYELEIRRRLWYSIGMLDTQLALDRGSLPLLYCSDFISWPLTVNDADLYPTCSRLISSQGFTDMAFSSMTHRAMMCQKKLYETNIHPEDPWASWNEKMAAIAVFEDYVRNNSSVRNPFPTPLETFTQAVGEGSLLNIKLMLRRPLHRIEHRQVPPWDDYNIMSASTEILERSLNKQADVKFASWAWFAWVKWYALAVLLAELYSSGTGATTEHSYLVARETFAQYAPVVADSESGMLWKPIVKLMRQVERLRGTGSTVNGNAHQPRSSGHSAGGDIKAGEATKLNVFQGYAASPQSAHRRDAGKSLVAESDLLDQTITQPRGTTHGIVDTENIEQMRMQDVLDDDLSLMNWDSFLEDMFHSTIMDLSMN